MSTIVSNFKILIEKIDVCRCPSLSGVGGVVALQGLAAQARAVPPDVTETDHGA